MTRWCSSLILLLILSALSGHAQPVHIRLSSLTILDEPLKHLTLLSSAVPQPITLPAVDTAGARYFKIFYSWEVTHEPEVNVMALSRPGGELLYIDRTYDQDLTNDGPPLFFPADQNEITFEIIQKEDPQQRTRFLLVRSSRQRASVEPASTLFEDSVGNLKKEFVRFYGGTTGVTDFEGKKGTFYWDERVSLRRGRAVLGGEQHAIGVFDYGNNGLFNDSTDLLLIDTRGDGKLREWQGPGVFKLKEVFRLGKDTFRVASVDKYGKWIDLERTHLPVTPFLLTEQGSLARSGGSMVEIDSSWLEVEGKTLEGEVVRLKQYREKALLLNFWGEWCKPCLQEMPSLVEAAQEVDKGKLAIVGFLAAQDMAKARGVIRDRKITWPQVLLTHDLEQRFRIRGFPTSILILPGTRRGVFWMGGINIQFLRALLEQGA